MTEAVLPARASTPGEVWASGDFARMAGALNIVAEQLCESAELHARERVLDVGTGTGNFAIAAAKRRCVVTGVDLVPALLELARRRTETEYVTVEFRPGNAEHLEFPDAAFDVVASVFGVVFAPDARRAASELLRVCRPGGRIALTAWKDEGWVGPLLGRLGRDLPAGTGTGASLAWGQEPFLREMFGTGIDELRLNVRVQRMRADSPPSLLEGLGRFFGPLVALNGHLDAAGRAAVREELAGRIARLNRTTDGTVLLESPYVEILARRAR